MSVSGVLFSVGVCVYVTGMLFSVGVFVSDLLICLDPCLLGLISIDFELTLSVCVCSVWVPCVALPSGGGSSAGSSPLCGSPVGGGPLL